MRNALTCRRTRLTWLSSPAPMCSTLAQNGSACLLKIGCRLSTRRSSLGSDTTGSLLAVSCRFFLCLLRRADLLCGIQIVRQMTLLMPIPSLACSDRLALNRYCPPAFDSLIGSARKRLCVWAIVGGSSRHHGGPSSSIATTISPSRTAEISSHAISTLQECRSLRAESMQRLGPM